MDLLREDAAAEYDRRFDALFRLAQDLNVPAAEAIELIHDVLISALSKPQIPDPDTWLAAAFRNAAKEREARMLIFRRRAADRAREFEETARRLLQERKDAPAQVDPLLRNTHPDHWPALAELSELQTVGALERLAHHFGEWLTKEPVHAHAIAGLKVAVAEAIPAHAYPAIVIRQVRAHAWKDLGKALHILGRNDEALDMFETAEQRLDAGRGTLAHDLAIVHFNRAMALQELERFEESGRLLAESRQVFREHGDTRNAILCGLAQGVLMQRLRRYREAREIYLLLLASTRDIDKESLASIHQSIGFCSIELGDFSAAEESLDYAIQLFESLEKPVYVSRVELGKGRLFIRRGEPSRGISKLRPVRLEFLRHSMHEEAGLCGLEMVEALLLLHRSEDAERLARTIVSEFSVAGLSMRAITALGYLSETIAARKAQPEGQ